MSYIENRRSIEDYLDSIKGRGKKNHMSSILNQFNMFCKQNFNKTHQQVIDDIKEEITKTNSNDKVYVLFNKYKDGLSQDHPEITCWSEIEKEQVRERQDGKCNKCGRAPPHWEYHHRNGDRSDNSLSNCEGLCPNCHSLKTHE